MNKKMLTITDLSSLLLSGCVTNDSSVVQIKPVVISVPKNYFNCPSAVSWPKADTLTDIQVAYLIKDLNKKYQLCKNSLNAVKQYLDKAQAELQK